MGLQEVEDHRTEMCIKSLSTEVGLWRLKVEQLEAKNTRSLANFNALLEQHNEVLAENKELEAELEHYRKRAIEFSNDVKKVEAELAESKTLTEIACSLLEDADAENKRLREALKPIYEHCKNNMQICGIVEQAKAALKGE